ncbi:hypothetical protein L1N85_00015 [Paenibacillus alkaliterrae]|uniref:hypothetical protein n=1 Tax=Paenibacillus alkaliterrae TaxID=320909 RepID=UPI001F291289|nr:hypothetical protein [Paenibacillus alkaliterrae]MCF2936814.1 hypothetical protein [Paenibacillus alkaliterrae]
MNKTIHSHYAEPIVDDLMLEAGEEQETEELVAGLTAYARSLELQMIQLRCRINELTPAGQEKPFPEPHTDLYESFDHYAAYEKFKHVLQPLE